tara:strand:- start:9036 stop:10181 length:1146 start_codon:yes stop_codon:yes gene_type:complete
MAKNTKLVPFNKPYFCGNELDFLKKCLDSGKISGDGVFTKKCQDFFQNEYGFKSSFLTTSCTDALEMSSLLLELKDGDEVILPSFTFVSTANPFLLRGAKLIFADSSNENPNICVKSIEKLISKKTKAIVIVHYAGVACDIDAIKKIINGTDIILIEDAAQAIDSYYKGSPLGTFGTFSAFSFHDTKNITCGEGGLLVVNDDKYINKAQIIREKGTNRLAFLKGQVDKYGWVDVGSSFLPSDLNAALLYSQLKNKNKIQKRRLMLWQYYYKKLTNLNTSDKLYLPIIPEYASNNAHMFYIVLQNEKLRDKIINTLKLNGFIATFHYQSLHKSNYFLSYNKLKELPLADKYSNCLLRLPLFYDLKLKSIDLIVNIINKELNK